MSNLAVVETIKQPYAFIGSFDELVPLIKEDLQRGREAGVPYFRAAGEKLLWAKKHLMHGDFTPWVNKHFGITRRRANEYMELAREFESGGAPPVSLEDVRRRRSNGKWGGKVRPKPWYNDILNKVDEIAPSLLPVVLLGEEEERALDQKLKQELISIGYKVLAWKLHPDKGGSEAAMKRLNRVKEQLEKTASP